MATSLALVGTTILGEPPQRDKDPRRIRRPPQGRHDRTNDISPYIRLRPR
ncbi:hypothetical protein [Streptomyces sp. NPDC059990]